MLLVGWMPLDCCGRLVSVRLKHKTEKVRDNLHNWCLNLTRHMLPEDSYLFKCIWIAAAAAAAATAAPCWCNRCANVNELQITRLLHFNVFDVVSVVSFFIHAISSFLPHIHAHTLQLHQQQMPPHFQMRYHAFYSGTRKNQHTKRFYRFSSGSVIVAQNYPGAIFMTLNRK